MTSEDIRRQIDKLRTLTTTDRGRRFRPATWLPLWEIAYQLAVHNENITERERQRCAEIARAFDTGCNEPADGICHVIAEEILGINPVLRTANVNPESPKSAPEGTQNILDRQFADFVSTESLEIIKENECVPGDLTSSRFRRVFNEIATLREAARK